jgi:hypothetical protein
MTGPRELLVTLAEAYGLFTHNLIKIGTPQRCPVE